MSVKYFCDFCGEEITKANACKLNETERLGATVIGKTGTKLSVQLHTAADHVWNKGEFCKYCILDAFNKLDDRPKEV